MELEELKRDCAAKQKKGLHFIMASVIIWVLISVVYSLDVPMMRKNFFAFCCTAPMAPLAYFFSKIIKVDFQNKSNPLTKLGLLFTINQIVYLLIAMWVFSAVPDKMLMVMAIIFGAHLMPYGWLYSSKSYTILSVFIPLMALIVGLLFQPSVLAFIMVCIEILFCLSLKIENNKMK